MSGLPQGSLPYKTIVGPALSLDWVFADLTWNIGLLPLLTDQNCVREELALGKR